MHKEGLKKIVICQYFLYLKQILKKTAGPLSWIFKLEHVSSFFLYIDKLHLGDQINKNYLLITPVTNDIAT